eukprot:6121961-Prymnesium_polylepis.1
MGPLSPRSRGSRRCLADPSSCRGATRTPLSRHRAARTSTSRRPSTSARLPSAARRSGQTSSC